MAKPFGKGGLVIRSEDESQKESCNPPLNICTRNFAVPKTRQTPLLLGLNQKVVVFCGENPLSSGPGRERTKCPEA
jgi:hypothetical protein